MSANKNEVNPELTHDKIQAEIANLNALTAKLHAKINESVARTAKINKETKDSDIITAKLQAEIAKILKENQWYPAIVASSATLAIVAIVKLFL